MANHMTKVDEKIYHWFINQAYGFPHLVGLITPYEQYDVPNANLNIYYTPLYLNTENVAEVLLDLFENDILLGINLSDSHDVQETYSSSQLGET